MTFVDVHAHLDHAQFAADLPDVLARAAKTGVVAIVCNGVNPETNRKVLELAKKYPVIKPALGIYPVDALAKEIAAGEYPLKPAVFDIDEEMAWIKKQGTKLVALGEIGLDNHWVKGKLEQQKKVFQKLIALAQELNKPVIVHSRDAEEETIAMLEACGATRVVLHCFGGSLKLAKRAAQHGWLFSIPPNIVRSTHFQRLVQETSINQLLTETDAPYLAPAKDQRNEPAFVVGAVKKIAELKGFTVEETTKNIFWNYQRVFL